MSAIFLWLPLIVNLVSWVLFFLFLRRFNGERLRHDYKRHQDNMRQQEKQTSLLQSIAAALEKHK